MRVDWFCLSLLAATAPGLAADAVEVGGHAKLRAVATTFADDSLFRDLLGDTTLDATGDLRFKFGAGRGLWSFAADYQLVGLRWDSLGVTGLPPDDARRYLDLTSVITDSADDALLHRLDRVWVGFASERAVVRVGRQALSWGNGLFYAPLDLVNPFDPAAIDTEYKAGDDMIYLQYLRTSGDDIQAAMVARRNPLTGESGADVATTALKYHGLGGGNEYDILLARHYGDDVLGLGASVAVGGAIWRSDLVTTWTDSDTYLQFVTNLTYSWVSLGKNMSGAVEYHYNGFGQDDGSYDPASLAANPDLLSRLLRGESYTLGRHYLAASVTVEVTPLWNLTAMAFANLQDPSGLLQFVSNFSLADDLTLLASVTLPAGPAGSEFGGPASGIAGRYLTRDASVFLQFAWYF